VMQFDAAEAVFSASGSEGGKLRQPASGSEINSARPRDSRDRAPNSRVRERRLQLEEPCELPHEHVHPTHPASCSHGRES